MTGLRGLLFLLQPDVGKLFAVAKKLSNERPLRVNRLPLFHNQHRHQRIGDQEQDGEHRQPAVLLLPFSFDQWYFGGFDGPK